MNRLTISLAGLVAVSLVSSAWALPPLPKYVQENYDAQPAFKKFADAYRETKTKCALCHIPNADKKAKGHGLNDFGKQMHDNLNDGEFKKLDKAGKDNPADHAKALKLVADALQKSEAGKTEGGQSYGDILRKGELPVK